MLVGASITRLTRLGGLEGQWRERFTTSSAFAHLQEQAAIAAVTTASTERRRDLVELLRTGLSKSDAALLDSQKIIEVLRRLNDAQVLILMYYEMTPWKTDGERDVFLAAHPGVFDVPRSTFANPDPEISRRETMAHYYETELVSLGLLKERQGIARTVTPVFEIAPLGQLLLHAINRATEPEGLDAARQPADVAHGS